MAEQKSDPKSDVQMTCDEDFIEKVAKVLQEACNDPMAFESVVSELQSMRLIYKQTSDDFSKAVLQAIIELPDAKHQQAVYSTEYAKELNKFLDKFSLLLPLVKGKGGASVVAGSLIKLLKGNKLVRDEWRDANSRNDIIEVLKEAEIVNVEQATEIITLVNDAIFAPSVAQMGELHADLGVGKITCRFCRPVHAEAVNMQVWLFGRLYEVVADFYSAQLLVYIAVQSTVNKEAGYLKFEAECRERKGYVLLGCQNFPLSLREIGRDDWFILSVQSLQQSWSVHPAINVERLASSYLSCLKNAPYSTPVAFASFLLSGESTTLSGILDVSIISGHNVQSSLKLSFNTTYEDTSSVSIGSPQELQLNVNMRSRIPHFHTREGEVGSWSHSWLYRVAEKIKDWRAVGLRLGLSKEDLDMCATKHSQTQLQAVEMLLLWPNKQHRVDKYKLVQVLEELMELEARRLWMAGREIHEVKRMLAAQMRELEMLELKKTKTSVINREEDFAREVIKIVWKARHDPVVLESAVDELELIKQSYKQTPDNLNKAVIQAVIELPIGVVVQPMPIMGYEYELKEILDECSALLEPLRGRKGAFLLDASVVADSLIKVLKACMLLPNEWREAQERNEIIRLLTKNEIVNKEQATKIIEFVNDAIPVKHQSYMAVRSRILHHRSKKKQDGVRPISLLHCLALDMRDWRAVGLRLGVDQEELNAIEYIYSERELRALEMLCLWRDKRYYGGYTGKTKLVQVLKEMKDFNALTSRELEELAEWEEMTTSIKTPVGSDCESSKQKYLVGEPSTSAALGKLLVSETQSSTCSLSTSSPDSGTGEFSAVFDHRGGCLGTYWSDDYLEIPKDAIPKGERWRVSGFIHTSLDRYQQYVDYNKGERLIAPVAQYRVEGGKHFKKLVKAVIHHSITCDCTSLEDKVSVLLQSESTDDESDHNKEELLPHKKQRKDGTAYFEMDSVHITVYTNHFSNIICKMCDQDHTENVDVKAMLYGRLNPDGTNSYSATVELYIAVQSALNKRAVYFESFLNEQKAAGNVFLGCQYFPLSLKNLKKNDRISLSTQNLTPGWNIVSSENTIWSWLNKSLIWKAIHSLMYEQLVEEGYEASDFIPCLNQPTDPRLVDVFMLRGKTAQLNGLLVVSINRESRTKLSSLKISFSLTTAGDTPSVSLAGLSVSSEQWKLSDMKLNYVAQNISDWHGVGLNLGISATELDIIQSDFCRDHPRQKVFEMLRLWRDKNNFRFTENELKAILRRALERVDQIDAVEELNNDVNQVLIDAEVRGNAVVTQVSGEGDEERVQLDVQIRPNQPVLD